MSIANELAAFFRRDLTRLAQELRAFPDDDLLWKKPPGVTNSAGNLALHLEGNLREYIGRQLGGVPYQRQRDQEFLQAGLGLRDLAERMDSLATMIPDIVSGLGSAELDHAYPENVMGMPLSTRQFLLQVLSHFNYHLGQIDYLRRVLTNGAAVQLTGL